MTWDVHRDHRGAPVTLTRDQIDAVLHALMVRDEIAPGAGNDYWDLSKSRLLGRMLIDGRPPLDECPPRYMGAPGYHLVEPDVRHFYRDGWPS